MEQLLVEAQHPFFHRPGDGVLPRDIVVERLAPGAFAVDEAAWRRTLTGTRVGLASWMSQCHRSGAPIEIVSASTGAVLAVYDVFSGLHSPFD